MGEVVDTMAQAIDAMAYEQRAMRRGEIAMANLRGTKGFSGKEKRVIAFLPSELRLGGQVVGHS